MVASKTWVMEYVDRVLLNMMQNGEIITRVQMENYVDRTVKAVAAEIAGKLWTVEELESAICEIMRRERLKVNGRV